MGFLSAIILFFITYFVRNHLIKRTLRKHLKREFQYNISLLQEWINEIDKILRKITAMDLRVYSYLQYSYFQRYFIQESFKLGIIYKLLNNEELSQLNTMLLHCSIGGEQYVNASIAQWKAQKINQAEALSNFEFEKEELQKYKKHLEHLLTVFK